MLALVPPSRMFGVHGAIASVAPDPAAVGKAVKLFGIVAVLLTALLLAIFLFTILRRRRLHREGSRRRETGGRPIADAWAEAGRRGEPIDRPPPPSGRGA